jgi:hypothetical protein
MKLSSTDIHDVIAPSLVGEEVDDVRILDVLVDAKDSSFGNDDAWKITLMLTAPSSRDGWAFEATQLLKRKARDAFAEATAGEADVPTAYVDVSAKASDIDIRDLAVEDESPTEELDEGVDR